MTPSVPTFVFAGMMAGLLWCLLWRSRWRWLGLGPVVAGVIAILLLSPPDILVTGDGRHVAVRTPDGRMAILRAGAGDYVRDVLSESAGYDGALEPIARLPQARCSDDLCAVGLMAGGRPWQLLVTRSNMLVDRATFARDCAAADIVIGKPGYGTISECLANRTKFLYLPHTGNPECRHLVEGAQRYRERRRRCPGTEAVR